MNPLIPSIPSLAPLRLRTIRFVYEPVHQPPGLALGLWIDEVDFRDLVRSAELPFATAEGHPERAGDYSGRWWPRSATAEEVAGLFLGQPDTLDPANRRSEILSCSCHLLGCWPLLCRIVVRGETVEWSDFSQPHRRPSLASVGAGSTHKRLRHQGVWRYDSLGTFLFSRIQYEAALEDALRAVA